MSEEEMVDFVKVLADADRLRIIGLLTLRSVRLSEIVEIIGFHPTEMQHHLDKLLQSGVVRLTDGMYELDTPDHLFRLNLTWERMQAVSWLPT
jgi:DNA-binding transcriptional ArsR family regulator